MLTILERVNDDLYHTSDLLSIGWNQTLPISCNKVKGQKCPHTPTALYVLYLRVSRLFLLLARQLNFNKISQL